jgi:hypothetical protein
MLVTGYQFRTSRMNLTELLGANTQPPSARASNLEQMSGIRYLPAVIVRNHVMAAGVIQFLVWEDYAPIEHKKGTISG